MGVVMFPAETTRTLLTATLISGEKMEPDIATKAYLESFLEYGCWLRPLVAYEHLQIFENPDSSTLQRMSSLMLFYQIFGQVFEDALTNYVAWSLWALDKDQSLPNIIGKLALRMSEPRSPIESGHIKDAYEQAKKGGKRINVYARAYLDELLRDRDSSVAIRIGINWKKFPSVKLVPKCMKPLWDDLDNRIRDGIEYLTDKKGALLATCYNKIKHGPQLIIMNPSIVAENRGLLDEKMEFPNEHMIRLLCKGARVQETHEELNSSPNIARKRRAKPL